MAENTRTQKATGMAGFRRASLLAASLGMAAFVGIASAETTGKDFTPDAVEKITLSLREADPSVYLIRLPVFRDGRVVGQQLYGSLPMKEVELLAESLKVRLDPEANIIAVFDPDEGGCSGGGGGGGGEGGGPGSHINTQSAAWDLANRLEVLLADIDASKYQFLR